MAVPDEHLIYLRRSGYALHCPEAFSSEEADILGRYGHWMEALVAGTIAPTTPEQQHFLQAARGEAAPETPFERAWAKLRNQPAALPLLGVPCQAALPQLIHEDTARTRLEQLAEARRAVEELREQIEAEKGEVLATVRAALDAITARYAHQLEAASRTVAELESEVKAAVVVLKRSVRAQGAQAIFYRGRVTWDSKGLADYAQANPEVEQFRKVGQPGVVVRYR